MNLGPDRLIGDLRNLGYEVTKVPVGNDIFFAVLPAYEIVAGKFSGRIIDLGIQCTANFPMSVHAAIHIKAEPSTLWNQRKTSPLSGT